MKKETIKYNLLGFSSFFLSFNVMMFAVNDAMNTQMSSHALAEETPAFDVYQTIEKDNSFQFFTEILKYNRNHPENKITTLSGVFDTNGKPITTFNDLTDYYSPYVDSYIKEFGIDNTYDFFMDTKKDMAINYAKANSLIKSAPTIKVSKHFIPKDNNPEKQIGYVLSDLKGNSYSFLFNRGDEYGYFYQSPYNKFSLDVNI